MRLGIALAVAAVLHMHGLDAGAHFAAPTHGAPVAGESEAESAGMTGSGVALSGSRSESPERTALSPSGSHVPGADHGLSAHLLAMCGLMLVVVVSVAVAAGAAARRRHVGLMSRQRRGLLFAHVRVFRTPPRITLCVIRC